MFVYASYCFELVLVIIYINKCKAYIPIPRVAAEAATPNAQTLLNAQKVLRKPLRRYRGSH